MQIYDSNWSKITQHKWDNFLYMYFHLPPLLYVLFLSYLPNDLFDYFRLTCRRENQSNQGAYRRPRYQPPEPAVCHLGRDSSWREVTQSYASTLCRHSWVYFQHSHWSHCLVFRHTEWHAWCSELLDKFLIESICRFCIFYKFMNT